MSIEIVLATRFGPSSAGPAAVATELARRYGGRLTVVYVAVELEALDAIGGEAGVDPHEERERMLAGIHEELRHFLADNLSHEHVTTRVVEGGHVADAVTEIAREIDADFLVVGTRGRGKLARLILGDTTQSILHNTPCPVVVVPLYEPDGEDV
jgi:nucleotide-binding universal stress UspA family protein